jgi:ABC-type glycerol-3-phosphate transport system substrate-binding protein
MDGNTNGSVQGGGSLFIGKGSKNREAAFEFMKWAVAKPNQIRMAKEMARWPVIADLYTDPAAIGADDAALKPYFGQLKAAKPYKLEAFPEGDKAWSDAVAAAYNGSDAQKVLNDAQSKAAAAIGG